MPRPPRSFRAAQCVLRRSVSCVLNSDIPRRLYDRAALVVRTGRITSPIPTLARPRSQGCTYEQTTEPVFEDWLNQIKHPWQSNRKLWEWVYILRCLECSGMLRQGKRGLGFAVGTEPVAALAAAAGCTIVATDLPGGEQTHWADSAEHAASLAAVNGRGLCPPDLFDRAVAFRPVDMRVVPDDLSGFDFVWSACAIEHLGDLSAGEEFVHRSVDCLAPAGVAVHTTEFNLSSNDDTVSSGDTVLYRRRDLEGLARELRRRGCDIELTFRFGVTPADLHVDEPPYSDTHVRTRASGYVITSFGLFIQRQKVSPRRRSSRSLHRSKAEDPR